MAKHPDELRADVQQYYGIDLDHAMAGEHAATHIAALVCQLPIDARIRIANNQDNLWTFTDTLIAAVANRLGSILNALGGDVEPIGPAYAMGREGGSGRIVQAVAMTRAELDERLSRPRIALEGNPYG